MYRIGKEEIAEVQNAIENRSLFKINDKLMETLNAEKELRELLGTKHAIMMTSGHAALTSALIAMGYPDGETVAPARKTVEQLLTFK